MKWYELGLLLMVALSYTETVEPIKDLVTTLPLEFPVYLSSRSKLDSFFANQYYCITAPFYSND